MHRMWRVKTTTDWWKFVKMVLTSNNPAKIRISDNKINNRTQEHSSLRFIKKKSIYRLNTINNI